MCSQYRCSHQSHVYKCNTVHLVLPCMTCMTEFFTRLSMLCGPPPKVLDLKKQGPHFAAYTHNPLSHAALLGSTVVSPYVGMARKQNGGYNASISVQTLIFHLVVNSTRLKTVRSALWRCPNSTVALRLLENVVKLTNLEVVKIEFRHLPILLSSSFFSQPIAP